MLKLYPVADIEEGKSKGFDLEDGRRMFAVKKNDDIFLYLNECPHLGINLEWQEDEFLDMDGALIQCSTHGALFEIDSGHCLAGPCQGDYLTPVDFEIQDGQICIAES